MKGEKWEFGNKRVILAHADDTDDELIAFRRAHSKLIADNVEQLTRIIETENVNIINGGYIQSPGGKKYISCYFIMSANEPMAQILWNILTSGLSKEQVEGINKTFNELGG